MVDWPGLLKWSLKYSDGTVNKDDIKPMDEATKQWLTEALKSISYDEIARMKEVLEFLKKPENNDPKDEEERLAYLEELGTLCEGLENARDLVRIGGLPVLINAMLKSNYEKVRKEAYFVFADCNQNNLMVQTASMEGGAFLLINSVLNESKMENKENAFSALSSLIRGENLRAKREFIDADGIEFLMELLTNPEKYTSNKLRTKVGLLLTDLVFYDDKLGYDDIVECNKADGGKGKQAQQVISLKKGEEKIEEDIEEEKVGSGGAKEDKEESKNGVIKVGDKKKSYEEYKNVVKRKLVKLKFVDLVATSLKTENLKGTLDFRTQLMSTVLAVLRFDGSVKLNQESEQTVKKLLETIQEENKKSEGLFDVEIELAKSTLAAGK